MTNQTIEAVTGGILRIFPGQLVRHRDGWTGNEVLDLYDYRLRARRGIIEVTSEFLGDLLPEAVPQALRRLGLPQILEVTGHVMLTTRGALPVRRRT